MAFNELMKSFDHLRDYMRDFFVYGYKTRTAYDRKSSRTYDNERRRIESYLGDYIQWRYQKGGKSVFVSIDSRRIPQNPFYKAYKSKSFTDNDITLHFVILDLLSDGCARTTRQITDLLIEQYGLCFEQQTVRLKLVEYAREGLLVTANEGRSLTYRLSPLMHANLLPPSLTVSDFLCFFSEAAPFAVIGSYLLDQTGIVNQRLIFKHHFLIHTLEDGILLPLVQAIDQDAMVEITNFSARSQSAVTVTGLPVSILVNTSSGRRYVALYQLSDRTLYSMRLDYIQSVRGLKPYPHAAAVKDSARQLLQAVWGVSLPKRPALEQLTMTLAIDEVKESYLLRRLYREKRHGVVTQIAPGVFQFTIQVTDANELMGWVKTFIGRIQRLECDNPTVVSRFYRDLERLYRLYEVND